DAARLLAQDVLAGGGGPEHPLAADGGRQRQVDGVDVAAAEQLVVGAAGGGGGRQRGVGLALVDEAAGAGGVAAGHGGQGGVAGVADRLPVLAGDVRRAQDAP